MIKLLVLMSKVILVSQIEEVGAVVPGEPDSNLIEPYIVEETNSFYTKTFFIRYAEELVVIRDIVKFRTEIDI